MDCKELANFIITNHDNVMYALDRCTTGNFAHTIANIKNIMLGYKTLAEEALQNDKL